MFFAYNRAANADNWLHECIVGILSEAIASIDSGKAPLPWPDIIPADHRKQLEPHTSVQNAVASFLAAYEEIGEEDRRRVNEAITRQNRLQDLFSNTIQCHRAGDLPVAIRDAADILSKALFKLLTKFGLRDEQYRIIYRSLKHKVCPFCGCEYFDPPPKEDDSDKEDPDFPRHDLDHYLARSIYPFAGVNLNNLAPMGDRCNKAYKKKQDIIYADGASRKCSDPFLGPTATISLVNSKPYARGMLPEWQIDLNDDCEEIRTWDKVFSIRTRLAFGILDEEYDGWLNEFGRWCSKPRYRGLNVVPTLLDEYIEYNISEGLSERAFLRRATFQMLRQKCDDPDVGPLVIEQLSDIIQQHRL